VTTCRTAHRRLAGLLLAGIALAACTSAESARADTGFAPIGEPIVRTTDATLAPASASPLAPTRDRPIAPARDTAPAPAQTPTFDSARAWEHLRQQVAIGPRPSGSPASQQTRDYLRAELTTVGVEVREQAFVARTPLGDVRMANIIGTIPGRRPDRIALASHYDTKLFREFRFVGANDGASSTAALLELGRVLASRSNEFTIELLFLDGEEARMPEWRGTDNTYGSRHYVQEARAGGRLSSLRALVLLDMIGDRDLTIRRDSNSTPWLVDLIWAAAERVGHAATFSRQLTTVEDDHIAFLRAGVPSVDLIDLDTPMRRGTWHTADDSLDYVSARSLQIVGDVVLASLPSIEEAIVAAGR
jgi:hypothetical protein